MFPGWLSCNHLPSTLRIFENKNQDFWFVHTTILLGKIYIFTSIKSQFISFTAKSNSIWEHFISNFQHFPLCCVWEAISFSVRNFYLCEVHSYFQQTHMFISASKSSIRRFVISEKAPTRVFSWLKVATTAFTFKTLLRHYAKQVLTPR